MNYRPVFEWGISVILASSLLSGCGRATPTPALVPEVTSVSAPSLPTAVQPVATEPPLTEEPVTGPTTPPEAETDLTTTPGETETPAATSTMANPSDLPFLMKIDRVSVVVGRGTLLEGRVAHGTLQGNGAVTILGPQDRVLDAGVLSILISSIVRDQVTVGDYAGILVEGLDVTQVTPGMLLSEAGSYESYEEALQLLQ